MFSRAVRDVDVFDCGGLASIPGERHRHRVYAPSQLPKLGIIRVQNHLAPGIPGLSAFILCALVLVLWAGRFIVPGEAQD